MSTLAQSLPKPMRISLATPAAAIEILTLFGAVAIASLAFVLGRLTISQAQVLDTLLLVSLVVLSWKRFDQGRHPCFLFLSMLLLLQGGRLLTYCLGSEPDPMRVRVLSRFPFDLSRDEAAMVLLCLAVSAICVYAPCRWSYRSLPPLSGIEVRRYLPYLYFLFYSALPVQLYKNYQYYQYIQEHGGYIVYFLNHGDLATSVPLIVRVIPLITLPAFVAIFIFEQRKKYIYIASFLYFVTALPTLLLGSRVATFGLVATLWYVARLKTGKRSRVVVLAGLLFLAILVADFSPAYRSDPGDTANYTFAPLEFVTLQGNSLDVTAVAVKYRSVFAPYSGAYLLNELRDAFVANDVSNYFRGKELAFDVPVLLNRDAFTGGNGTGGSYIGEAFVIGGLGGVIVVSFLIGGGLHLLHCFSKNPYYLFLVAMILPDIIFMARGNLLNWISVLLRSLISVAMLVLGWWMYRLVFQTKPQRAA
jgi:oligosaccharide repeat unit polymerase